MSKPRSKTYFLLARIAITLGAAFVFLLIRADVSIWLWQNGGVYAHDKLTRFQTPGLVKDYLAANPVAKLHLGAGHNNKPGWLNTDIEPLTGQAYLDATEPFPLPDQSVMYVTSEHVIEHITYEQGMLMLKESYRVLKPGGRMRVATPNLQRFIALFQEQKSAEMKSYVRDKTDWHDWPTTADQECYILNLQLREWGHRFVYTPKLLRARIEEAGFKDIQMFTPGESNDPALRGLEMRAVSNRADVNRYETQIFEAVRP